MKEIQIRVRLPEKTHKALKRQAKDEGRSMGKQAAHLIKSQLNK